MTTTHISAMIDRLRAASQRSGAQPPNIERTSALASNAEAGFASWKPGLHAAQDLAFSRVREWVYGIQGRDEGDRSYAGLGMVLYSTKERARVAAGRSPYASGFGCGKTHLMTAAAHYLSSLYWAEPNVYGVMSHLPRFKVTLIGGIQFIEGLRNLYSTNGSVNDYFRSMTQGPLFIDDIGKEYVRDESSGWAEAQYHRLIDHCYVHRLPLMLTSNLDVDGLLARIGGAAASRLIEMCGPNARGFVDMSAAPDYRVSQGQ